MKYDRIKVSIFLYNIRVGLLSVIFTDFVGSQLKESFKYYKRLKAAKKEKEMRDIKRQDLIKVKFRINKNLKNMKLPEKKIIS